MIVANENMQIMITEPDGQGISMAFGELITEKIGNYQVMTGKANVTVYIVVRRKFRAYKKMLKKSEQVTREMMNKIIPNSSIYFPAPIENFAFGKSNPQTKHFSFFVIKGTAQINAAMPDGFEG